MTIVRLEHAAQVPSGRYCVPGMRAFFKLHGLDFADFCRNGIDAQKLRDTKDAMAIALARVAENEEKANG